MSYGKLVRHMMAPFLLVLAVLGAFAPALFAARDPGEESKTQKHENRREIDQLELAWRDAVMKVDTAAMDKLLDDDYIAILPSGTLQSKEQTLANMRGGTTHFASFKISDRRVRFYGTTALVTSRADVTGSSATGAITGSFRYTCVYARDKQGEWKIVSFEANRIRGSHKKK
jgi:ketosteroid isomerase-like protein